MGAQAVRLTNVDIDNALKNRDFEVLFQPIFDLGNGALARVETFVRWRHRGLGVLPPGAFISFFESQGRMSELTRYVLGEALNEYQQWRGSSPPGFSINLALSDLTDEAFASHFDVLLRDRAFPADLITLECPMPPVTADLAQAADQFRRLSATGARLAIEVRGRANDFLRQIDPFPFDEIKTGGAAILRFARTVRGPGLSAISELLEIAAKANAAITAVGVEDQASLSALRGLGFAAAQGNHLGKVGPLSTFSSERVNEVRALLGLEALSTEDLAALFRTEAPAPRAADGSDQEQPQALGDDDLVERLAARLASQRAPALEASEGAPAAPAAKSRSAKAAAAIRTAAAKAAAIAKAKRKAAVATAELAEGTLLAEPEAQDDAPPAENAAARSLQARLSRAFDALEEDPLADAPDDPLAAPDSPASLRDDLAAVAEATEDDDSLPEDETPFAALDAESFANPAGAPTASEADIEAFEDAFEPAAATAAAQKVSLSVKDARAHFRPGVRIGIIGPKPASAPAEARNPAFEPLFVDGPAANAPVGPVGLKAAAPMSAPAPQPAVAAEIEIAIEPEATEEMPIAAPAPRKRKPRRKNFLTRTVIPYPTHFWPRWMRRKRARTAGVSEDRNAAADAAISPSA